MPQIQEQTVEVVKEILQEIDAEKLADDVVDEMILETDVDDDAQQCTAESDAVGYGVVFPEHVSKLYMIWNKEQSSIRPRHIFFGTSSSESWMKIRNFCKSFQKILTRLEEDVFHLLGRFFKYRVFLWNRSVGFRKGPILRNARSYPAKQRSYSEKHCFTE